MLLRRLGFLRWGLRVVASWPGPVAETRVIWRASMCGMDSDADREGLDAQAVVEGYAKEVAVLVQRVVFAEARISQLEKRLEAARKGED